MEVETLIARWTACEGGAERANYQMFLTELCDVIDVGRPDPAGAERAANDYVFERGVKSRDSDPVASMRRIDLYKKGCFILEAKQSRSTDGRPDRLNALMARARRQAEDYVFLLEASHPAPPFLLVCDVGRVIEIYSDFSGTGRAYTQFRGRTGFRITLEDLRRPQCRELLRTIWTDPHSLNPARESARVTRQIADRLAKVSRSLESNYQPEEVALFMMRAIFCMFAEDVDLLPRGKFTQLLQECVAAPRSFVPLVEQLWSKMDTRDSSERYFPYFDADIRYFNGNLYRDARAFPLQAEEIGELVAAAKHKWTDVDPAIFGTLLEQALEPSERRKLGAHYTPRAYVVRLVEATVMEPLRADWRRVLKQADGERDAGNERGAATILRAFHHRLCTTRVLDPACGTGNFLYVCLQLMKTLEGEVLEALVGHGETGLLGLDAETVGPQQFLGLELNPRAAAIAELVIWIGFLQEHYRTHSGHPGEPILRAFQNINFGMKDGYDAVLARDANAQGEPIFDAPSRPDWPQAEFIVGNPPFIGKGAAMRSALGDDYVDALWAAHRHMNESADFVMYWWDRAAELLTRKDTVLRRFGLVTTNSISQVFNRRTIERHIAASRPVSLIYAIPDHPWTKATKDSAAVRIAMTVCEAGKQTGTLLEISDEADLQTDEPHLGFVRRMGMIHADLTTGPAISTASSLTANSGIACNGMMLAGRGFVLTPKEASYLCGSQPPQDQLIKPYQNGGELVGHPKRNFVIDAFGFADAELRQRHPAIYQHLLATVKPGRSQNRRKAFRERWWIFGEPRKTFRPALSGLGRYIGTTETAKHRIFQFLDESVVPDHMIIAIASNDAAHLAVLSSRVHRTWALAAGGWLGIGNDPRYSKSRCFDPFPFPDPSLEVQRALRDAGEELDAARRRVLEEHVDLTMTGLYNILEKLRAGTALSQKDDDVKTRGLVLILEEIHEAIDRLTAEAYGWPRAMTDGEILARLVALNTERAREEARGRVRWLRPAYQEPRLGGTKIERAEELPLPASVVSIDRAMPAFPTRREEQILAVADLLASSSVPMQAAEIARAFKHGGKRLQPRIEQLLSALARFGHIVEVSGGSFQARERERIAA